jgi:type IV pilus assembly protein PilC
LDAGALAEALAELKRQGFFVLSLAEKKRLAKSTSLDLNLFARVQTKDLMLFCSQLATMLAAGVPLVNSLEMIAKQIKSRRLRDTVSEVSADIQKGHSLCEALRKHPKVFPALLHSIVKAGEESGTLDHVLQDYASQLERSQQLRQQIFGALLYPSILFVLGVGVMIFLVTFVLPTFVEIIADAGVALPWPTRALVWLSETLRSHWPALIISMAAAAVAGWRFVQTERGRRVVDASKLRLPILGPLVRKAAVARLARTMAVLMRSGLPFLTAVRLGRSVVGNLVFSDILREMERRITEGEGIAEQFRRWQDLPPMVTKMISVGEETGQLESMWAKLAEIYDREVQQSAKTLTTMLEPAFILLVGLGVGFITLSLIMALMRMMQTIQ